MFDRSAQSGAATSAGTGTTEGYRLGDSGRHALFEDADLTPIFYGLVLGARNTRAPQRTDPVDAFSRDPLTAPIPAQVLTPSQRTPGRRAARAAVSTGGRHHYRG